MLSALHAVHVHQQESLAEELTNPSNVVSVYNNVGVVQYNVILFNLAAR
jgi:hypothetical protein